MPYRVEISPAAQRQIRRMGRSVRQRLEEAAYTLEGNPQPIGSVKLRGHERMWRIRVGGYRVSYEVNNDAQLIVVLRVAIRGEATYRGLGG